MTTTHVIILAQGTQQRLGNATGGTPKQLLPLPACNHTPIMVRTLLQLDALAGLDHLDVTVVSWSEVFAALPVELRHDQVSLLAPGNSSLKGIARYLGDGAGASEWGGGSRGPVPDHVVVLLGDVVYSWSCLEAIFCIPRARRVDDAGNITTPPAQILFCGTSDIGPGGGELWGVAWTKDSHDEMMLALATALARHPKFEDTYQPGQLRQWMWAVHPEFHRTLRYRAIDDYTMDVDLPEHVPLLAEVSERAAADDLEHGVSW